MSRTEVFERLLASLHEAVLDEAQWPAAAALVDQLCGSKGNSLVYGDDAGPDDVDLFFTRSCAGGEIYDEQEREYFELYHAGDERLPHLRQLPDSHVAPVTSLLTEEQMRTSPVYNEMLPTIAQCNALHARLDGPGGARIVWTACDPVAGDGWSSASVRMLKRILPHVRQFIRVRHALVNARAMGASLGDLLAHVGLAVLHLDRQGRVVAANDRARALLHQQDGLVHRDGGLHASRADEDEALQKVLARALPRPPDTGASGSVALRRARSPTRLVVHVTPVAEGGATERSGRVGALVMVVDPDSRSRLDARRVGAMLGLTPAESHVAVALAEGKTIQAIAEETGRSPTTVKWHVGHVFGKLGVSRQVDLVRLVLALPDVSRD